MYRICDGIITDETLRGIEQKGCEGFRFALNESTLAISNDIEVWLDSGIESMQKKKQKTGKFFDRK